jgi:hypothetical protein
MPDDGLVHIDDDLPPPLLLRVTRTPVVVEPPVASPSLPVSPQLIPQLVCASGPLLPVALDTGAACGPGPRCLPCGAALAEASAALGLLVPCDVRPSSCLASARSHPHPYPGSRLACACCRCGQCHLLGGPH